MPTWWGMIGIRPKLFVAMLAALALVSAASADARHRHRSAALQTTSTGLPVDSSGTPIIMQGYQANKGRVVPQVSGPITVPFAMPIALVLKAATGVR